jgi:outer membrane protease
MKSHTSSSTIWIAVLFIGLWPAGQTPLAAQEKEPFVTGFLEAGTGSFFSGVVKEYVINPDGSLLSRLDWQERAVSYATLTGRLSFFHFFLQPWFLAALPGQSGIVEDYDWIKEVNTVVPHNAEMPSHYSRHTVELDYHVEVSGAVGYTFRLGGLELIPSVGLRYLHRTWTGRDGYALHPETAYIEKAFSGPVLVYEQEMVFPFAALELKGAVADNLDVRLRGAYTFRYTVGTLDNHLLTGKDYFDSMSDGSGGALEAGWRYYFDGARRWALSANIGYEWFSTQNGSSVSRTSDGLPWTKENIFSKTSGELWTVSLSVTRYFSPR